MRPRQVNTHKLSATQKQQKKYVLSGRLADVPPKRSKVVRIFLSSTFTDTYTERNLLIKETYPRLKRICKEKYGLEFQVVDMRWGVKNEASNDHSASALCMKELKHCQDISVGPNFVALVSHRYGTRPIPVKIPQRQLNLITEALTRNGHDDELPLIEDWFKLDENAIPPEFILQPLNVIGQKHISMARGETSSPEEPAPPEPVPDFDPDEYDAAYHAAVMELLKDTRDPRVKKIADDKKKESDERYRSAVEEGRSRWKMAEPKLATSLRKGVIYCIKEKTMTAEDGHTFTRAVTDEELENGILKFAGADEKTLCFIRDIESINLIHPKAWRFIDQHEDGSIDQDAQDQLEELKKEKLANKMNENNMFHFKVTWSDNEGINDEDHSEYLKEFCDTFERSILRQIDKAISTSTSILGDALYDEILEHAHQCKVKCERFLGRPDILEMMETYLMKPNAKPLVIYGESGSGKTSLIARAASLVPEWFGDRDDVHIILRFMGTTPLTSTISSVLSSVVEQLQRSVLGNDPGIPTNFFDLKDMLNQTLDTIGSATWAHKKVIILLDSIDQLSPLYGAHELDWLPMSLPPNIHVIVSTLPKEHALLKNLKIILPEETQYVQVEGLSPEHCQNILHLWLDLAQRRVTQHQEDIFKRKVRKRKIRPLYLKLMFDEIVTWRSYQSDSQLSHIQPDIESSILQLYDRLERKHGGKLVQRAFGYLAATKNGLTEGEMEDLLSLDDEVLNTVFEFHLPPIRRLPSILWARIRADISEYIVDREADGARVMAWYHRQFIEYARTYCCSEWGEHVTRRRKLELRRDVTERDELDICLNIYDYFNGKWGGGKRKPFVYTKNQMNKYKITNSRGEENRFVSDQPALFRGSDGTINLEHIRYNDRKISELPYAMSNVLRRVTKEKKQFQENAIQSMIFDWEYLTAWVARASWAEISAELEIFESGEAEIDVKEEVELMRSVFLLCITTLYDNPMSLGVQIAGRMLLHYKHQVNLTKLIDGIEGEGRCCSALIAPHYNLDTPGGTLLNIISNHHRAITASVMTSEGLVSVSDKLVVVNMDQFSVDTDVRPRAMPTNGTFKRLAIANDFRNGTSSNAKGMVACAVLDKTPWIFLMNLDDGQVRAIVRCDDSIPSCIDVCCMIAIGKYLIVSFTGSNDILIANALDGQHIGTLQGINDVHDLSIMSFHGDIYMMVTNTSKGDDRQHETFLHFYLIGQGQSNDDDSDGDLMLRLTSEVADMNEDDDNTSTANRGQWWEREPVKVSLGDVTLCSQAVSPSFDFAVFATVSGELSYIISNPEDEDDDDDTSDESGTDSEESEAKYVKYDLGRSLRDMTEVAGLNARMKTISVDDFPINRITTLRSYVIDEMLLAVACTSTMMVVFEMTEGIALLRVKKSYDAAQVSIDGNDLLAYAGGVIDVYRIDLSLPGIQFIVTLHAHTGPISQLGFLADELMVYTCSTDGSLKFWDLQMLNAGLPKFHHGKHHIGCITTDQRLSPEKNVAVSIHPGKRWIDIWHIMSGTLLHSIHSDADINEVVLVTTKVDGSDNTRLVALSQNNSIVYWDITDLTQSDDIGANRGNNIIPVKVTIKYERQGRNATQKLLYSWRRNEIFIQLSTNVAVVLQADTLTQIACIDMVGNIDSAGIFLDASGNYTTIDNSSSRRITYIPNKRQKEMELRCAMGQIISASADFTKVLVVGNSRTELCVFDTSVQELILRKTLQLNGEVMPISICCLTPDGKHVVLSSNRQVLLIRVSDGRLIANVTLYDGIESLDVSADGWFALMGMPDKRLYILLISDTLVQEHDERVPKTRHLMQGIDSESSRRLCRQARQEEGDDESEFDFVTFIDMDKEQLNLSLSRGPGSTPHGASAVVIKNGALLGADECVKDSFGQQQTILTNQLCNLQ